MISIFAMTVKGFEVISKIIDQFSSSFIDLIICSKDNNIEKDYYEEIKSICKTHNIKFADRTSKYQLNTHYCFAISWRWLINLQPDKKLIVFHDSLLPKYRGFAPLVNSLINAESEIGVTALFATDEYDKGGIIYQSKTDIIYPIKIENAITINNKNYIKACLFVSELIKDKKVLSSQSQNENEATYSLWRDEDDYKINWGKSAGEIKRFIDAIGYPYKGALTFDGEKKVRIIDAEEVNDLTIINRDIGKIISIMEGKPVVVCGQGLLKITNAVYDDTNINFLPLKKFRTRLQ